ncbi:MAG: tRNA (adenosine(37)-N6)-threonylcarbamoyltransferase complex transferase subunit TsaD [Fibrobacterales bacterium]
MITLGIESSCDETACGIVDDTLKVYANCLYSQIKEHRSFGGVVPEIAARAHLEKISAIVDEALTTSGLTINDIDQIAYTRGPGLMGPLLVGASFAKGLAHDLQIPSIGINHLEGHIAAVFLSNPDIQPPFCCLTVSGGHTELTLVKENFEYELLGRTRDDAAGEAFDKCGKLLGLGYPAGPVVGKAADGGNRKFVRFPRSFAKQDTGEFSFSGLKTSVLRYVQDNSEEFIQENLKDICASLEEAIVDILCEKSMWALKKTGLSHIVVCGGVSANRHLRKRMETLGKKNNFTAFFPDFEYCTDNGAMIAAIGQLKKNSNMLHLTDDAVTPWLELGK